MDTHVRKLSSKKMSDSDEGEEEDEEEESVDESVFNSKSKIKHVLTNQGLTDIKMFIK